MFCDKIIEGLRFVNLSTADRLRERLMECPIFEITNVSDYMYKENPQEDWVIHKDIPNMSPPFRECWFEWTSPEYVNSENTIKKMNIRIRNGVYFKAMEMPENMRDENTKNAKWIINCACFTLSGVRALFFGVTPIIVMPEGNPKAFMVGGKDICGAPKEFQGMSEEDNSQFVTVLKMFGIIVGLAISFLHCKNVTTTEKTYPPKLQKARQKRKKPQFLEYHMLEIHPMKKVLETEGNSRKTGIKQALHICRGHFKDYSIGKGLFGRYKGLYWWDDMVRGSKEVGEIKKTYEVHSPAG